MKTITIGVAKPAVMAQVAEATAYAAAKGSPAMPRPDASGAVAEPEGTTIERIERITTIDADEALLDKFWNECRSEVYSGLQGLVREDRAGMRGAREFVLELSAAFDESLTPSMGQSLNDFFVQGILGRWYAFTNKTEAGACLERAAALLEDIDRKARRKSRPVRRQNG